MLSKKGGILRKKIDYSLKAQAISEGYDKLERDISKTEWNYYKASCNFIENGEEIPTKLEAKHNDIQILLKKLADNELFKEARKINHASYEKRNRLEKRIAEWLSNYTCIFVTLTFKPDVLESTSKETRRKYVTRALKQMSDKYVANIDFGKENEREHYHAIVVADNVSREEWKDYGAINFKRIKKTSDSIKLAKYVVKLTNHAMKETVHQNRVIYSKN